MSSATKCRAKFLSCLFHFVITKNLFHATVFSHIVSNLQNHVELLFRFIKRRVVENKRINASIQNYFRI
jgi:hypothetical protein